MFSPIHSPGRMRSFSPAPALFPRVPSSSPPYEETRIPATDEDRNKLYAEFAPLVRRLIRQYGDRPEDREDLVGIIYCYFHSLLDAYDPARGVPLRPYLVRQLSLSVYTYVRQQRQRSKRCVSIDANPNCYPGLLDDPTTTWNTNLMHLQVQQTLPDLIASLPERQRYVVIWRYYEERSFEEIADALGIQTSTARSLLRHALNNLRRSLNTNEA